MLTECSYFFLVTDYLKWKEGISNAVIHSPKVTHRPVLTWSSTEDGSATALLKSKCDSVERDDVFQKIGGSAATSNPGRPNTPLNSSPRVYDEAHSKIVC